MTGVRSRRTEPVGVVGAEHCVEVISAPFTLEPGQQHRGLRCLLCGSLIGGRLARIAVAADMRATGTRCGGVRSAAYLICAEHADDADPDISTPALAQCERGCKRRTA